MCFSENNLLTNIFTYLGLEGILKSGKETIPVRLLPCTVSTSDPSGSFRETRETAHLSCSFVVLKDYLGPGNFLKKGDLACPTVPEARAARRRHCGEGAALLQLRMEKQNSKQALMKTAFLSPFKKAFSHENNPAQSIRL